MALFDEFIALRILGLYNAGTIALSTIITMLILFAIDISQDYKRLSVLNDECDPERFLKLINKKDKDILFKKSNMARAHAINKSTAYFLMGEPQKALDLLKSINIESIKNGNVKWVYTVNIMACYYEIGNIEQAQKLYNEVLTKIPVNNKMSNLSLKIEEAEYAFYSNKYEDSKEKILQILNDKVNNRLRVYLTYYLAQCEEALGNVGKAMEYYLQVSEQGNKLWIANVARKKLVVHREVI